MLLYTAVEDLKNRRDVRATPRCHNELTARFQDTTNLAKSLRLIRNMHNSKTTDNGVKIPIVKGKVLRVGFNELTIRQTLTGMRQHLR